MRAMSKVLMISTGLASLVLAAAGPAVAQALEEITVTARKQAENLQEVPLAVTAISEDEIQRLGIRDLNKLAEQDPSVQFDEGFTPSDTRVTIRGLSPTRGRPNAATLVDGIDVGSEAISNAGGSVLVNPRLLDVQRIEIVKGPQSALYGRSAFAGAIQYVTKDPTDTPSANLAVDYNSQQDSEIRGSASMPLGDTLGVLVNGYAWDNRGYYRNSVTNAFIGGGEGAGASLTFKWEPTDAVDFKWRTEYTDDEFAPPAQVGLNAFNKWVDLGTNGNLPNFAAGGNTGPSNIAPNSSNCAPDQGPLANPGCLGSQILTDYFTNNNAPPFTDATPGLTPDLGQYDPNSVANFNQYNRQVINTFIGQVPDADNLRATLNPNYQFGPGAITPAQAIDYPGTDKEVFRTSLVGNWRVTDDLTLTSYTGFTEANVTIQQDVGRFYVDECSADVGALELAPDPTGNFASYAEAIRAQGISNLARFAPCNAALGPDGINDSSGAFLQDDMTDTSQLSQEFRAAWQISDELNFTTGVLYWRETVEKLDRNTTLVASGPGCYLFQNDFLTGPEYGDASQIPVAANFLQLNPLQDQCGNTSVIAAYWLPDTYEARVAQPTLQQRRTRHYSWYGSLEWDITDRFRTRIEARFTREDNSVTAPVMTPCLNGAPANDPGNPGSCTTGGAPDRNAAAAGGQPTGPSSVTLCGSNGRCDRLGIAPISGSPYYANAVTALGNEFSWWNYGYAPMLGIQATPPTRIDRYWTPKATFEYSVNDDILTYVSWSRGIKPGGYSLLTIGAFGLDPNLDGRFDEAEFEPERLDVWELGTKTTLFDGRMRLNGSLFFQDFKDKQISLQKVIGNTTGIVTENISGSEIWGFETDVSFQASDNWLLRAGYTFLHSEYTDYTIISNSAGAVARESLGPNPDNCQALGVLPGSDPAAPQLGCVVSFNGNELERTPKHAFLLNANYRNSLFDTGLEWYGEVNFRFQDSRFIEQFNDTELKAYSLTNLQFGIDAATWGLQIYVDNLFDDQTVRNAGPSVGIPNANFAFGLASPPAGFTPGVSLLAGPILPQDLYGNLPPPRLIGARLTWRFGD
ncbi:MAG: TonB-dependent receptor plug domain-containing protein [Gammaproteobacteria bacterium]|jgi:outer membrane receptor protein involved in Fe transport|nr:TonB-dependent receptor plug domain-containing protein [Gammaproteobacteria bacterium]